MAKGDRLPWKFSWHVISSRLYPYRRPNQTMTDPYPTISRWKAAGIHLVVSFALALGISALIYLLWFPPPYFIAAGATTLMLLIIGVDVVIGPALTLLVFNPTKPKHLIRLDLAIIGVLQAIAFAYGLYVICQARPVFVVAAVDRLKIVMANELSDADLAKGHEPEFRRRSWTGPVLVGAKSNAADTLGLALQALSGGKDIDALPQYYVPYHESAGTLSKHARPITALKHLTPAQSEYIQSLLTKAKERGGSLTYVPLQSRKADYAAILSPQTEEPIAVLATDPW